MYQACQSIKHAKGQRRQLAAIQGPVDAESFRERDISEVYCIVS